MDEDFRAGARAQFFGPEMLVVISPAVTRLDEATEAGLVLEAFDLADLLKSVRDPLADMRDCAEGRAEQASLR